jgi:5'-deoxynucleotidase YfbR-like HD superfamily hydrolase|tara:strand:- start:268 stop:570 length:303 start_codon:yes stop_codon:yes gene_type:complete
MIVERLRFNQFHDAFFKQRKDNFSYDGLKALYDYLEDFYLEADKPYELDVIALCCEYSEYEDLKSFNEEYDRDYENIDDIQEETTVIRIPKSEAFIIQQF